MAQRLGQFTAVRTALVVGGLSLSAQAAELRSRPEIVVATPGRLIDHLRNTHRHTHRPTPPIAPTQPPTQHSPQLALIQPQNNQQKRRNTPTQLYKANSQDSR